MRGLTVVLAFGFLVHPGLARVGDAGNLKRPRLDLRASPAMAFSPVSVLVVAKLVGGDDHEDYYCPGMEWDWGDGSRSTREGDCEPFGPEATVERLFSARHAYRGAGSYSVRLTLVRASRTVAVAEVAVIVRGAPSDE